MNYFQTIRLGWIEEALRTYGYIRRSHIARKFDISEGQASTDLAEYQKQHPGTVRYDHRLMAYVRVGATVKMIEEEDDHNGKAA